MSFFHSFKRALGLDHEEADLMSDPELPTAAPATLSAAEPSAEPSAPALQLPDSLVDALRAAVDQWAAAQSGEADRERRDMAGRLEEARLSAERQKRAFNDRIADLSAQLDALRNGPAPKAPTPAAEPAEPTTLGAEAAERERLQKTIDDLRQLNDQLDAKSRINDKMLSDINAKYADLRREHDALTDEHNALREAHAEAQRELEALAEIQAQMEKVEEIIAKKDARIAALQKETEEQAHTIEQNLYNQANSEMRLRMEIKALRKELEKKPAGERRRRAPKADTAGREDIDNGDSFDAAGGSDPAADTFGYQPPARGAHNQIPDVPTLF